SLLWHEIAAQHGVICPYGPYNLLEWNHCQPTWVKVILAEDPLRETVTADGPISLQGMFEIGYSVITASSSVDGLTGDPPAHPARQPRIPAAANIRTAYERGPPQTSRSIFDSRVKNKFGWPKEVPRIANLDGELRRPKSSATSRTLLKPIVMPRIIVQPGRSVPDLGRRRPGRPPRGRSGRRAAS